MKTGPIDENWFFIGTIFDSDTIILITGNNSFLAFFSIKVLFQRCYYHTFSTLQDIF